MKRLLFFAGILCTYFSYAQNCGEKQTPQDEAEAIPWYGKYTFLDPFVDARIGSDPNARISTLDARYYIPLRLVIYRDNTGDPGSAIPEELAISIAKAANDQFTEANTSIKFFVREVEFVNNDFYRAQVNQEVEIIDLFYSNRREGVVNVHFVYNVSSLSPGYAVIPSFLYDYGAEFSQYIETHNNGFQRDIDEMASTMAHELGHNFGLFHTHHPGRVESLIFNENNATIENTCYQEVRSRVDRNYWYEGCANTNNKKKCTINGDFLCDTAADPNVSPDDEVWVSPDCSTYTYTDGGDYEFDNRGDRWNPPLDNIMSYTRNDCANEFSWDQKAVMWYTIENRFLNDYDPGLSGPSLVCGTNTSTFSVDLPEEIGVVWSVSDELSIIGPHDEHSVEIRASSSTATDETGWIDMTLTFPHGGDLIVRKTVEVGLPETSDIDIFRVGNSFDMVNSTWNWIHATYQGSYDYNIPRWEWRFFSSNGVTVTTMDGSKSTIYVSPSADGSVDAQARVSNLCGCSGWKNQNFRVGNGGGPTGSPRLDY